MRSLFLFSIGLIVALGGAGGAAAQSISVQAQATPGTAGLQESIVYKIQVTGAPLSDIETPEPPPTTNLVLKQSTPSRQRDLSFKSGRLGRTIAFQWRYRPMRVGIARFRPAEISIRGETYTTDEIRVRVVPQAQRPARSSATPHGAPTAPSPSSPSASGSRDGASGSEVLQPQDLFIRATADAKEAYQNEQITIEYRLFFRPGIQLRHSRLASAWDANGFWREELDVASRPVPRTEEIDGQTYRTIVLKRVAVFPTRTGSLQVDPLTIETEAHASHRSSRDHTLQSRFEPVTLSSEALTLTTRPLPDAPPAAFDGAVGDFTLTTDISTDSVAVGEAITLRATIGGTGNLATLQPPPLEVPSAFERYDPTVTTDIHRGRDEIRGSKTFTYTVVARKSGTFTLPPIAFAYFDPDAATYRTLRSRPTRIRVTGEAQKEVAGTTGDGLPVGDIAGLMTSPGGAAGAWQRLSAAPLYRRLWTYGALAAPLLLAVGVLAFRRRRASSKDADDGSAAARKSVSLADAQAHLREARQALEKGESDVVHPMIERAVRGFLENRLDLPAPGMTQSSLDDRLQRAGVREGVRSSVRTLLDACDRAQYTPASPSPRDTRKALTRAEDLLRSLHEDLPSSGPSAA
jgi:hypothetical protein